MISSVVSALLIFQQNVRKFSSSAAIKAKRRDGARHQLPSRNADESNFCQISEVPGLATVVTFAIAASFINLLGIRPTA